MKMRLNELADVITVGQIMSRVAYKDEEEKHEGKEVRVLVPSAISGGMINHNNLGSAVLKKKVSAERITQEGDIIIKLSSPYDCALVQEDESGLVVPSFCAVIRGFNMEIVDTRYLVGVLNSVYVLQKLQAGINSTAMAMIRSKSLQDLDILLPSIEEQKIVGQAYWESCKKKRLLEIMVGHQQLISDNIIIETLLEVKHNAGK